eukprot:TRINITY_DN4832_c0_g2_i2.p1 TRINITY_DN4832_c0_g2~~TRINITY_DN4832_c0_g2_i2.p1  ORF type:complete len:109 (-),score=30.54 TRINITY_DN4832_c0_g2_i2:361-687(-)
MASMNACFLEHTAEMRALLEEADQKSLLGPLLEQLVDSSYDSEDFVRTSVTKRKLKRRISEESTAASTVEDHDAYGAMLCATPSPTASEPSPKRRRRLILLSSRTAAL